MIRYVKSKSNHDIPAIFCGNEWRLLGRTINYGPKKCKVVPYASANPVFDLNTLPEYNRYQSNVPILDQDGNGSCFPPGTYVRMFDGSQKKIEEIRLLDEILTAEGNKGVVKTLFVRPANKLYRLVVYGHQHLKATEEHPILTKRGYVKISELVKGDVVGIPRYLPNNIKEIYTKNYYNKNPKVIVQTRRYYTNINKHKTYITVTKYPTPEKLILTAGLGRIFGLFLAEGHVQPHAIRWTFNINEKDTLVAELKQLIKNELGLDVYISERLSCNSIVVTLCGIEWARLFYGLFSTGSRNKSIHPDLLSGPNDFLENILNGWLDGDGYYNKKTTIGNTISHNLALNMFDIGNGLGKNFALRVENYKKNDGITRQPCWKVSLGVHESSNTYRCNIEDKYIWRTVRKVEEEDYDGYVYNMEIESDNSYVAEGIGVHNCCAHAHCIMVEKARDLQGLALELLSADSLYAQINGGQDNGSNPSDAIAALQKNGICLLSDVPDQFIRWEQISDQAKQNALRFRIPDDVAVYQCRNFQEAVSADYLGFAVTFTINCGNDFNNLDKDGVVPYAPGEANHSVSAGEGMKRLSDGTPALHWRNSWTTKWGLNGCAYCTAEHMDNQSYGEIYALKWTFIDPESPDDKLPF